MIKLNFPQKNRAEHGAVQSEEAQTLLSKKREKLQFKLSQARFYIEFTLNRFSEGRNLLTLMTVLFQAFPKHIQYYFFHSKVEGLSPL
jgi:hypothetical protein